MRVGDLIVGNLARGYEIGLIIGEKPVDPDDPYETQFRVMWDCGKTSYPSQSYLEHYKVVNESR